jgi:ribosomal protein S6--L-glutamate ligase
MRIGILGWDREEPESVGLLQVGREMGHDVVLFALDDIEVRHTARGPQPYVFGRAAADFEVIMSRAEIRLDRVQADHERFALLCNLPGVTVVDPADTYLNVESKFLGMQRLGAAGLPVAPTRSCRSIADVADAVGEWGTVVLKPSFGYGGTDVEKVSSVIGDKATIGRLLAAYPVLVCQPYLPHPEGDIRVNVVGEEAPVSFRRIPQGEGWKANVMQGAVAEVIEPPAELVDIAIRAARIMGITISGLDFVPTPDGYRIVEINNTPGWYMLGEADQRHIMQMIYKVVLARREADCAAEAR